MQGQPRGAALVLEHLAVRPLRVHLVAADRVAGFREVNANLVRAARFQPAREQRVTRQPLLDRDVRDRFLPNVGQSRAAAATVPAILNQVRAERLGAQDARHDRQVAADDRVFAELQAEGALRQHRPREDDQPARFLVEPVNDPQPRDVAGFAAELVGDGPLRQVLERGVEFAPLLGPLQFRRVPHGVYARRLLHDDDVLVQVPDDEPFRVRGPRERLGVFEQDDGFVLLEAAGLVGADRVADLDAAGGDELAHVVPRRPAEPRPQHLREREPGFLGRDGERGQF